MATHNEIFKFENTFITRSKKEIKFTKVKNGNEKKDRKNKKLDIGKNKNNDLDKSKKRGWHIENFKVGTTYRKF
ncbi:MAG: hypothetical protein ACTSPY_18255 [Candidatus Helarchaeota archaeon]